MTRQNDFQQSVERDEKQQKEAEQHKPSLFGFLLYGGTLGLLMALPMVGGAYLGLWLDSFSNTFGTRWTVSFIILGVVAGVWNVVWYLREHS